MPIVRVAKSRIGVPVGRRALPECANNTFSRLVANSSGEQGQACAPVRIQVKSRRIFSAESLQEHGLAHAAVAEDRNRRHAGRPGMDDHAVQVIERLFCPWIKHPTLRKNRPDAPFGCLAEQSRRCWRQVRSRFRHEITLCPRRRESACANRRREENCSLPFSRR